MRTGYKNTIQTIHLIYRASYKLEVTLGTGLAGKPGGEGGIPPHCRLNNHVGGSNLVC